MDDDDIRTRDLERKPAAYKYSSLNPARREIRVLIIHPGHRPAPVACSVFTVSLYDRPDYTALSYVWGDPSNPQPITIDGATVHVTRNLYDALLRLRIDDSITMLWIDAICINQNDTPEKNYQVPLMRYIYSQASKLIVWFGEPDEDTEAGVYFIRDLVQIARDIRKLPPDQQQAASRQLGVADRKREWRAIHRILERPWFSRVWVWQELALVKEHLGVEVKIGHLSFPWMMLAGLVNYIPLCEWEEYLSSTIWTRARSMEEARSGREINGFTMTLLKALSYVRDSGATNPRDKVYGLLGFIEEGVEAVEVDYAKPVEAVYTDVTKYLIRESKDLVVLSLVQSAHNTVLDLPSWVPDFSQKFYSDLLAVPDELQADSRQFHVSDAMTAHARFDKDKPRTLIVKAILLGTVAGLGTILEVKSDGIDTSLVRTEWLAMLQSLSEEAPYPLTSETNLQAFARTIIADRDFRQIRATPRLYTALSQYLSVHSHSEDDLRNYGSIAFSGDTIDYENAICFSASGKRFFVDEGGWMGLAPEAAQEGDRICLFFGAQVPFLIRKHANGDGNMTVEKTWRLVGECYVHGIMDGEVVKRAQTDKDVEVLLKELAEEIALV